MLSPYSGLNLSISNYIPIILIASDNNANIVYTYQSQRDHVLLYLYFYFRINKIFTFSPIHFVEQIKYFVQKTWLVFLYWRCHQGGCKECIEFFG